MLLKEGQRTFQVIAESRLSSYAREANPRYSDAGAKASFDEVVSPHSAGRVMSGGPPRDLEEAMP